MHYIKKVNKCDVFKSGLTRPLLDSPRDGPLPEGQ